MISVNRLIGSFVYRTRKALDSDPTFLGGAQNYFVEVVNNGFNLFYYPGTPNEISNSLLAINKNPIGMQKKFPAVFNFMPIEQEIGKERTTRCNLAFVTPTKSEWTTEQRDKYVFEPILRPMYKAFMKQLESSRFLSVGYGKYEHRMYEVYTTGNNQDEHIKGRYTDYVDAIEIHDISLTIKNLCDRDIEIINEEYNLLNKK